MNKKRKKLPKPADFLVQRFLRFRRVQRRRKRSKEIERRPEFQDALYRLRLARPIPKSDEEYCEQMNVEAEEQRKQQLAAGKKRIQIIYHKDEREFCERWGIDYNSFRLGKVVALPPVIVGDRPIRGKRYPYLAVTSVSTTEGDIKDYIPLLMEIKNKMFGRAIPSGRPEGAKVLHSKIIRMCQQLEACEGYGYGRKVKIYEKVGEKVGYSPETVKRIYYSRKTSPRR